MQEGEIIVAGSDISPLLSKRDVEFLDEVDKVIAQSILQSDPTYAFDFGRTVWKDGHLKGLALAKFLAKMGQQWYQFQVGDTSERFEDAVNSEIGISAQTVRKYSSMWENLFENDEIPEATKKLLYGKPIKSLLLLTAVARDGEPIDWGDVGEASTGNEIRDLVRAVRGEQTSSKSALRIVLDRQGQLKVQKGMNGETIIIGNINLALASDPDIKKAIMRITERAGVIWQ